MYFVAINHEKELEYCKELQEKLVKYHSEIFTYSHDNSLHYALAIEPIKGKSSLNWIIDNMGKELDENAWIIAYIDNENKVYLGAQEPRGQLIEHPCKVNNGEFLFLNNMKQYDFVVYK